MDMMQTANYVESLLEQDMPALRKLDELISFCAQQDPSPRWNEIRAIDWAAGLSHLRSYLSQAVQDMPPDINALYAGIATYSTRRPRKEFCDFYLAGTPRYLGFDEDIEWAFDLTWNDDPSGNPAMFAMYQTAYRPGDDQLGNHCEYPLALGFVNFGLKDCLDLLPDNVHCVAAGFDSGDYLFPLK